MIDKRLELEKHLESIGWSMRDMGCNIYRIYNHKDEATAFEVTNNRIQIDREGVFGTGYYGGTLHFLLEACTFKVGKDGNAISIKANEECFLSFYNHDMIKT